jgi:hypothetical protein
MKLRGQPLIPEWTQPRTSGIPFESTGHTVRIQCTMISTTNLALMDLELTSVKIPKYQYVGFDFPILDEMW